MDRIYVMELVRSFQVGQISQREFVKRAKAAIGSAASATALLTAYEQLTETEAFPDLVVAAGLNSLELSAKDSEKGLHTSIANYEQTDDPDKSLFAYYARPENKKPVPGLIVIQEWWGLNDHIKDVTRRFARAGYAALAPDLYHGVVTTEPDVARKLVMELDLPNAVREIRGAITHLLSQPEVKKSKVGIIGFCMGGRLVFETALVDERLAAAIPFYGLLADPAKAAQIKSPLLGIFGELDKGIPIEKVRAVEQAMKDSRKENKFKIYEGAGHAFFNDARPAGYNETAAKDAWQETLVWLQKYL